MTTASSALADGTRTWLPTICWLLVALLAVILLCSAWQGPDIFYHLFLGKRVLETGKFQPTDTLLIQQPHYLNLYWLFQVVAYGFLAVGGVIGVTILMILGWLATLLLWIRTGRLLRVPAFGVLLSVASLLVLQNRFDPRPEVFSYLFLSLQLYWLSIWDFKEGLGWRRAALFAASQVLWTNTHVYFVFGPALVGLRLLSSLFHGETAKSSLTQLKLLGLVAVASMVSPFGPKVWTFVITLWSFLRVMRDMIVETRPPLGEALRLWTIKLFWLVWGVTLLAGILTALRRRWRLFHLGAAVLGLYLGATSARNIPLTILLAAPLWRLLIDSFVEARTASPIADTETPATTLPPTSPATSPATGLTAPSKAEAPSPAEPAPGGDTLPGIPRGRKSAGRLASVLTGVGGVAAILLCVWIVSGGFYRSLTSQTVFGVKILPHAYPIRFVEWFRSTEFSGKIFNDSRDGGYLELYAPRLRLYKDSRYTEPVPARTYFQSLRDPSAFLAEHDRFQFDGVLLSTCDSPQIIATLLTKPAWKLAYVELHRAFLVRHNSPAAAAIPDAPLQFYTGDDLSLTVNGRPAIEWVVLIVRAKQTELLREALRQLSTAPRVPSVVVQYGLGYGLQEKDRELVGLSRSMAPKMIALSEKDRSLVETLLRQAASQMPE